MLVFKETRPYRNSGLTSASMSGLRAQVARYLRSQIYIHTCGDQGQRVLAWYTSQTYGKDSFSLGVYVASLQVKLQEGSAVYSHRGRQVHTMELFREAAACSTPVKVMVKPITSDHEDPVNSPWCLRKSACCGTAGYVLDLSTQDWTGSSHLGAAGAL